MIWKPKLQPDDEILRKYSAPSLLRQYHDNKWRTTTQTTYQNYFMGNLTKNIDKNQKKQVAYREELLSESAQRSLLGSQDKSRLSTRQEKGTYYVRPHR